VSEHHTFSFGRIEVSLAIQALAFARDKSFALPSLPVPQHINLTLEAYTVKLNIRSVYVQCTFKFGCWRHCGSSGWYGCSRWPLGDESVSHPTPVH